MRFFFLAIILFIYAHETIALEPLKIEVNSSKSQGKINQIRINFFCKQPVNFSANLKANAIQINFNRRFTTNFSSLLTNTKGFIIGATISKDGSNIILALSPGDYSLRKFFSDKSVGFDLIKKASRLSGANSHGQDKAKAAEKASPGAKTNSKQADNSKTTLKDKAKTAITTSEQSSDANITNLDLHKNKVIQDIGNTSTNKKLIFPWQSDVAAAMFYQAGYLWLIFNSQINIDIENIKASTSNFIEDIKQLKATDHAILYIKTAVPQNQINLYRNNFDWILEFQDNTTTVANDDKFILQQPDSNVKGIFFPAKNIASPISFTNPIIGNKVMVVPFYYPNHKVPNERRFVDFILLPTRQGFAISVIADYVQLLTSSEGIEVLTIHNNNFNNIEKQNMASNQEKTVSSTLLPYIKWYNLPAEKFLTTRQSLQADIINADKKNKPNAIFALSQFFLGKNFTKESSGINEYIEHVYPNFANNLEFKLSQAVSNYMNKRYIESKIILDNINLDQVPLAQQEEIKFWQNATTIALDIPTPQYDILEHKNGFLSTYPNIVKCTLAVPDIRSSFVTNKLDDIKKILDYLDTLNLNNNPTTQKCYNSMQFYTGLYEHKIGHNKKALKIWHSLAENIKDRLNSTRANFSIVKLLYELDKITIDEAITRLNKLRNSWRGNRLDARLLEYLADLYYKNQNYPEALRVWAELIRAFPRSTNLFFIQSKMSKLFVDLFQKDGLASKLAPFQAISLFFEFYDLLPIGKIGDDIIQNIAYTLVKLDLLDKAATLLEHEISYRLTGQDRAKVGTKLAFIYLIDQKPKKTLEILAKTFSNDLSEQLLNQRTYIKAKALIDTNKLKEALTLIQNDYSDDAYQLKAKILWTQKNCLALEKLMINKLDKSPHAPIFTPKEEEELLHIILCYMANQQQKNAETLYYNFQTYLSTSGILHDTFNFIIGSNNPLDISNIAKSIDISSMENFLNKYNKSLLLP